MLAVLKETLLVMGVCEVGPPVEAVCGVGPLVVAVFREGLPVMAVYGVGPPVVAVCEKGHPVMAVLSCQGKAVWGMYSMGLILTVQMTVL